MHRDEIKTVNTETLSLEWNSTRHPNLLIRILIQARLYQSPSCKWLCRFDLTKPSWPAQLFTNKGLRLSSTKPTSKAPLHHNDARETFLSGPSLHPDLITNLPEWQHRDSATNSPKIPDTQPARLISLDQSIPSQRQQQLHRHRRLDPLPSRGAAPKAAQDSRLESLHKPYFPSKQPPSAAVRDRSPRRGHRNHSPSAEPAPRSRHMSPLPLDAPPKRMAVLQTLHHGPGASETGCGGCCGVRRARGEAAAVRD